MGTKANLQAGTGVLYIAPTGEALPEYSNLTPPTITVTPGGNWSANGYTIGAHGLNYQADYEDVFVNESRILVKKVCVKEGGIFKVRFAETDMTAFNLAMAASTLSTVAAGADQTAQDILKLGDGTVVEKALLYLASTPEGGSRLIHIPFAVATGSINWEWNKGHSPFDVEFSIEANMSASAGQRLFTVYDITAVATS